MSALKKEKKYTSEEYSDLEEKPNIKRIYQQLHFQNGWRHGIAYSNQF